MGPVAGPFKSSDGPVSVRNLTTGPIQYSITTDRDWVTWDVPASGGLAAGDSLVIDLGIDASRAPTQIGSHTATVTMVETPNQTLYATIHVRLDVEALPMTAANRTSGVAPLAVFFDAVDTSEPVVWESGVLQPDDGISYADLYYAWSFGDPESGTWPTTGNSRNEATGYTAAHVYETPGTYTVNLMIEDPAAGTVYEYAQEITVLPYEGETRYVDSEAGNDANDGRTPATPWKTIQRAFSDSFSTHKRVLFKRSQTFQQAGPVTITAVGPGIVGAYGQGEKPVLEFAGTDTGIRIYSNDWRIMDVDVLGRGAADEVGGLQLAAHLPCSLNLFWNVTCRDWRVPIGWADTPGIYGTPQSGNFVAGCTVRGAQINGMYVGGRQLAVIGNDITGIVTSHALRAWQAHKGCISQNILRDPGPTRLALKLHGPAYGTGALPTRFVTISDNLIRGRTYAVSIAPQNTTEDERLDQIVFERNRTESEPSLQVDLVVWAQHVTVRNNVFVGTGSSNYYTAVDVGLGVSGSAPPARQVDVYGNTMFKSNAGPEFFMVRLGLCSDVRVRNNLGSAPLVSWREVVQGSCEGLTTTSNLLADDPSFVNSGEGDFRLNPESPAVGAGVWLPALSRDAAGRVRSAPACDLGALER